MEFLGKLGIDIRLLIAQMINFGLLLWILVKFVYKPIVERIEKDEHELKTAQEQAASLEKDKVEFTEVKMNEIAKSKKRAQEIIKEAEDVAGQIKNQARRETEEERQAVVEQIRARLKEIENEQNPQQ